MHLNTACCLVSTSAQGQVWLRNNQWEVDAGHRIQRNKLKECHQRPWFKQLSVILIRITHAMLELETPRFVRPNPPTMRDRLPMYAEEVPWIGNDSTWICRICKAQTYSVQRELRNKISHLLCLILTPI